MNKVINEKQATQLSKDLRNKNQKIVLVGGCFDILHVGHVRFLKKAKEFGTIFVLLESDESIKKLKGEKRPFNGIKERAEILSSFSFVDYVIEMKGIKNNEDYDKIITRIAPDFIAITKGDEAKFIKQKQAMSVKARIIEIPNTKNRSSSRIQKLMEEY
jgi:rfaE bifunctional protein nucleotidyltransferase chain/domain